MIGDRKTVALLYKSSSNELVPYILPLTCSSLNLEICDQSGDDIVLYEFAFTLVDQANKHNAQAVCNVVIHRPNMTSIVNSNVRYDLLKPAKFPLSGV